LEGKMPSYSGEVFNLGAEVGVDVESPLELLRFEGCAYYEYLLVLWESMGCAQMWA
jgi:hypothetical protein